MKSTKFSSGALESLKVEPFLLSPFRSKDLYKLSIGDTVPKEAWHSLCRLPLSLALHIQQTISIFCQTRRFGLIQE